VHREALAREPTEAIERLGEAAFAALEIVMRSLVVVEADAQDQPVAARAARAPSAAAGPSRW